MARTLLLIFLVQPLLCWNTLSAPDEPLHSLRPNIVLFMADDMGMGDTSAYQEFTGNPDSVQLYTPNLERLARMGMRFTDAHTPSSRCTTTRYSLLTGRYVWRSRLKYWVLFGVQGDPLIEADRPTLGSMLRDVGYHTGMVGKWHVGLRYRRSDGSPAAGWNDADLTQPLHTSPLDAGFDFARYTSRSHGTSGPDIHATKPSRRNSPDQSVGPGHLHGRTAIAATRIGKKLVDSGPQAYELTKLGSRHSDHAMGFLNRHIAEPSTSSKPFFLYYPANANHGPYTPDKMIGGKPVAGASRTRSGEPMDARHDLIYENDVALGRLLDWLAVTPDPRNARQKLAANTIVIFTSDNGAEKNSNVATGPFRSHKGSCYEGGHRVPFIVSWPAGGVGDGDEDTTGQTSDTLIGLQDLYATFAEIAGSPLPDLSAGEKGAEDSFSLVKAWQGKSIRERPPMFFNDHKEAKSDPAVLAMRLDSPRIDDKTWEGQWKIFFNARLIREGLAEPAELYDLATDTWEKRNRVREPALQPLVKFLTAQAVRHRSMGGHRFEPLASETRVRFNFEGKKLGKSKVGRIGQSGNVEKSNAGGETKILPATRFPVEAEGTDLEMTLSAANRDRSVDAPAFSVNERGLGLDAGGKVKQVDDGEALLIQFNQDVLVESVAIVAGNGTCGGYYQVGGNAPLAIYCVDADNDSKDQRGILSDIGLVKKGEILRLDSRPHFGVEAAGQWRVANLSVRLLAPSR